MQSTFSSSQQFRAGTQLDLSRQKTRLCHLEPSLQFHAKELFFGMQLKQNPETGAPATTNECAQHPSSTDIQL
ncbi:MAG: hypothetical protein ACK55Z_17540, partial [bacterium]